MHINYNNYSYVISLFIDILKKKIIIIKFIKYFIFSNNFA